MSGGAMVSWAIAVVSEFDSAGRRIPEVWCRFCPWWM